MNSKLLLLAVCVLSMSLVSCGNDEPKGGDPTPAKIKSVECSIKVKFLELGEVADITITYFDETGASKSEVVTTETWEKKFTTSTFPIKLTPTIFITAKTGTPSKEKYDILCKSTISYTSIRTDGSEGKKQFHDGTAFPAMLGISVANLDTFFFKKYGNKDISLGGWTLELNDDGTDIK